MNHAWIAISAAAILLLAGCNQAKSPDAVNKDVASAQRKAAEDTAKERNSAAQSENRAENATDNKIAQENNTDAKAAYDVAMTQADGEHKVALQKCEAFNGDAQKHCKDQADANYDAAKSNAKATENRQMQSSNGH